MGNEKINFYRFFAQHLPKFCNFYHLIIAVFELAKSVYKILSNPCEY